jgi:hypothetical protein
MSDWDEDYQEMDENGNPVDTWAEPEETEHPVGFSCKKGHVHAGYCEY